eukprot:scaffold683_cov164-Amphora_coffeaeformis.AAC.1
MWERRSDDGNLPRPKGPPQVELYYSFDTTKQQSWKVSIHIHLLCFLHNKGFPVASFCLKWSGEIFRLAAI